MRRGGRWVPARSEEPAWRGLAEELKAAGPARPERIGSAETGAGRTPLETDDGFPGMDRGKTLDAQRGEREPATAPLQSAENPIQAVS
jgi:hypothetical protein